jgi:1-acyl-sn-glycerol-3-phosphate acyltransferase
VVPVAHDAGRCWRRNAFLKLPGTITVSIGQPIDSRGRKADALTREVETWIESEMQRIDHARA